MAVGKPQKRAARKKESRGRTNSQVLFLFFSNDRSERVLCHVFTASRAFCCVRRTKKRGGSRTPLA